MEVRSLPSRLGLQGSQGQKADQTRGAELVNTGSAEGGSRAGPRAPAKAWRRGVSAGRDRQSRWAWGEGRTEGACPASPGHGPGPAPSSPTHHRLSCTPGPPG